MPFSNVQHLRLFYLVARHGGITAALPHVGYGIQQPALSEQILQLEQEVGGRLFVRRPFALLPAGQLLYDETQAFFGNLGPLYSAVVNAGQPVVRVAAPDFIAAEYLPELTAKVRATCPALKFDVQGGGRTDQWIPALRERRLDLVLANVSQRAPGVCSHVAMRLPLVLVAPARMKLRVHELWQPDVSRPPLIVPSDDDGVWQHFDGGLKLRRVSWRPQLTLSSSGLVAPYVAKGCGVGVSVQLPSLGRDRDVKWFPLPDFAPVDISVLWARPLKPAVRQVLVHLGVPESRLGQEDRDDRPTGDPGRR